jgi:hypothetical protein
MHDIHPGVRVTSTDDIDNQPLVGVITADTRAVPGHDYAGNRLPRDTAPDDGMIPVQWMIGDAPHWEYIEDLRIAPESQN